MLLSQIESKLHWLQGRAEGIIHFLKFYIKMAFPRFFFFEALFKCHFDNTLCNVNKKVFKEYYMYFGIMLLYVFFVTIAFGLKSFFLFYFKKKFHYCANLLCDFGRIYTTYICMYTLYSGRNLYTNILVFCEKFS